MRDTNMKAALRIGAVAAGAALALGTAGAASAATPGSTASAAAKNASGDRLALVKGAANARIQGRLGTLHALAQAVQDSKFLTSAEQGTLGKQIESDLSGLTALSTKTANETAAAAVRADEVVMVDDYRVYLLMAPQTRLTEALAAESDAATTLQKAYAALQQLQAKQSGGGSAQQKSELADLQSEITAAQAAIGNEVAAELAIQPGPDESAIKNALAPAKSATKTARQDLLKARDDAKDLRSSLKS
jgi:hypothetical protein